MARITVEDCIDKFSSRFELVLVASNRARRLHSGETPTVDKDNDKNTVIALREIASETLTKDKLKNDLIEEYQTTTFSEEEELEELNELEDKTDEDNLEDENNLEQQQISNENENQLVEETHSEISNDDVDNLSSENKKENL